MKKYQISKHNKFNKRRLFHVEHLKELTRLLLRIAMPYYRM